MLLTCEQPVSPVQVEILFEPFPPAADVDVYTVTCRTASERLVRAADGEEGIGGCSRK